MKKQFGRFILLGTSHIAKESIRSIHTTVSEEKPEIIAVELDRQRLYALLHPEQKKMYISWKVIRKIGVHGFLFALIGGYVQERLAKKIGMEPGIDMKVAVETARSNELLLCLIDQNIEITLARLSQEITWREKFRFVGDIFRALIFRKREMERLGLENLDLERIPPAELVERLIKELKNRYPNVYKVLVEERNDIMARKLVQIAKANPDKKILAVLGAGHVNDMVKKIQALERKKAI